MNKLLAVILVAGVALVACTRVPSATETPVPPTEVPTVPTEATVEPVPTLSLELEATTEPGGVEVALALIALPDQETIALVNGEPISTAAYKDEITRAIYAVTNQYGLDWNDPTNRSLLPTFQDQVLNQMIDTVLLRQLAAAEGITVDQEEIEAEVAQIRQQVEQGPGVTDWASFLAENSLTEENIRELVADQKLMEALTEQHGGPRVVEQVHASHILVETEETGQEVLDKLAAGEEFGALAAEYSIDPGSKDRGGDLDWFPRGVMVPEFEEAAFALEPGQVSGLVQTAFGYHIIKVHEKGERELDPALYARFQQQQFQAWFEAQRAEAEIERLFTFESQE